MLTAKVILDEECRNIKRLLDDTLRYAYGTAKSEEFYKECFARLTTIAEQLTGLDEKNAPAVHFLAHQLHLLSNTITRIERSHIGELSWPFALSLKQIALGICRSNRTSEKEEEPLFFFSAEGGLFVYRVYPQQTNLSRRRIFNVIFPRSLKHQVLLHAILGHEMGHVAYAFPNLRNEIETNVTSVLLKDTPFSDPSNFEPWIERVYGYKLGVQKLRDAYESWRQEYFCDLFGLLIMGPSFLPAYWALFQLAHKKSNDLSVTHPPPMSRYCMLDVACTFLKWEAWEGSLHKNLSQPLASLYSTVRDPIKTIPQEMHLLSAAHIGEAITALQRILQRMGATLYEHPAPDLLSSLMEDLLSATPPAHMIFEKQHERWMPVNIPIDFRHILFAGWLAAHQQSRDPATLSLFKINRLCDRAILHQEAVDTWYRHQETGPRDVDT